MPEMSVHIDDTDLELYVFGRLIQQREGAVESHVAKCNMCTRKMSNTAEFMRELATRICNHRTHSGPNDRRGEHRIPTDEPASMQLLSPFVPQYCAVRILDVSANGIKLQTPHSVDVGSIMRVRLKNHMLIGEVRYSSQLDDSYQAGMQIFETIPTRATL